MREYIDSRDVANTAMMLATAFDGTVVLVEGITDRRLYGKFFDSDRVETVVAHSKSNVRNAVRELYRERHFERLIGIVDADLDRLYGRKRNPPLFLTDTRDAEGMLLRSNAFKDILDEYGEKDRMDAFVDRYGDIREAVLSAAYPIGLLMYISETRGLSLSFKDLDYEQFIDRRTLRCDVRRMLDLVLLNSQPTNRPSAKNIMQMLNDEEEHDVWDVCRGHDLMSIMAIGLRHIFGGNNCRNITGNQLSGGFRLAFDEKDIVGTDIYRDADEWCTKKGLTLWSIRR